MGGGGCPAADPVVKTFKFIVCGRMWLLYGPEFCIPGLNQEINPDETGHFHGKNQKKRFRG